MDVFLPVNVQPPERVLVDRWPLWWRQPRRFEVVAFRRDDRAKDGYSIKRVSWLPGELPGIRHGELYQNHRVVQKSPDVARQLRVLVHENAFHPQKTANGLPRWRAADVTSAWQGMRGDSIAKNQAQSGKEFDWLIYEHWPGTLDESQRQVVSPVTDNDAYNQGEIKRALNEVNDVLLTCHLQARGRFCLAAMDRGCRLEVIVRPGESFTLRRDGKKVLSRSGEQAFTARENEIEFGLVDGQVLLVVNGNTVLCERYSEAEAASDAALHPLAIGFGEGEMLVRNLCVWRDIHYLDAQTLDRPWQAERPLGPQEFGLLGDNQTVSVDSRQWEHPGVPRDRIIGIVHSLRGN